jgi:ubiquinone/menaquinone biosynthesis C-methylase UbiE
VEYDRTPIPDLYVAARALSEDALAVWREAIGRLLAPGRRADRVVDLGCGAGRLTPLLAEVVRGSVIGVDASRRMLAQRPIPASSGPRYLAARAEALPFAAAAVDVVFLAMVYHHLEPPGPALREIRRVLRPGGCVVVGTPTLETLEGYAFLKFFPGAREIDRTRMPSRAAVIEAFAGHGLARGAHAVLQQPIAATWGEYARRIARRALTSLQLVPDDAFASGLRALERDCATRADDGPVVEPVDLFLFERG